MRTQTTEVLGHVERLLLEAGSSKAHILSCQIFIRDPKDFDVMNEVWDAWVVPGHTPPSLHGARPHHSPGLAH